MDKVLDLVGLQVKPPPSPEMNAESLPKSLAPKKVTLRIHAGDALNVDPAGRSLSLVTRIYKVKDVDAFLQSPYDAYLGTGSAKVEGVSSVREVVLTPGQKYEVVESMPAEATHLAVVGLFRAPDGNRWRFVFEAAGAAKSGVTLGAHGCALSVAQGEPLGAATETMRVAGVRCR